MPERDRLGALSPEGESLPHVHPRTYRAQATNGGERLRIGVRGLGTLRALLDAMPPPFWILYLHLVPRTEDAPGRYRSETPWNRERLDAFLDEYRELLETDGRYDLWVKSVEGPDLLVYDRHEIVFAYGGLDRFRAILQIEGYEEVDVLVPNPHEHPYRPENDAAQRRLLAANDWTLFPLAEDDLR